MSLAIVPTPAPRHRPRDVLQVIQSLRRQNPRAPEARLAALLMDELLDDRELLLIIAGDLVRKALAPAKVKPKPTLKAAETARRQRVASQETEKQTVKVAAEKMRQRIALDTMLVLIGGGMKELRYCTAGELRDLSGIYGRIAAKVMEAGGPAAMVGEIICARDLEEICAQSEKASV